MLLLLWLPSKDPFSPEALEWTSVNLMSYPDLLSTNRQEIWVQAAVTVIKASPSFRPPHSQNPSDMGSPSYITLAIWVRVRIKVTGDAHITEVLGMGMPKTGEMPISL